MKFNKIVAILLIVAGLGIAYTGINTVSDNSASVEVLDVELDLSNESGKEQGYIYMGLGVLLFVGGLYTLKK